MRDATLWRRALGVDTKTVIDKVVFEEEGDEDVVIVRVRQHRSRKLRCGKCSKVAGRYDKGEGRRRWRALNVGLLGDIAKVKPPECAAPPTGRWWRRFRGPVTTPGIPTPSTTKWPGS